MVSAKLLYAMPLSTHGGNGAGGGKEKYPLNTSQKKNSITAHYEEHPVTSCGQTIILTNGELAAALLSLPEKEKEIIYLYFFGSYTQQEMGKMYRRARSTMSRHLHSALQMLQKEMEVLSHEET